MTSCKDCKCYSGKNNECLRGFDVFYFIDCSYYTPFPFWINSCKVVTLIERL